MDALGAHRKTTVHGDPVNLQVVYGLLLVVLPHVNFVATLADLPAKCITELIADPYRAQMLTCAVHRDIMGYGDEQWIQ